jgi:hypothetical protein
MDAGTYNVQKATCHYDCDTCNGAVSSALVTVPFGLAVGGSTQLTFQTTWNTGVKVNLSSSATWGTSASSVATVSAGLVKGVAAGSVTINGVYEIEPLSGQSCGSPPRACPIDYGVSASGGGAVQPTLIVQGNEYSSIFVGSDPNLAGPNSIFASGTPSGGTFTETSSVSSDTFTPVKSGGPGWVVGTTTQSSSVGDRTLAFTYTVNDATASQSLTVTARQFAYATSTSPANSCALGYGTAYVFTYTPYTHPDGTAVQAGIGLTNTAVTESFNPQPPAPAQTGNSILNANSQFTDTISYCSTAPLTISATITQTISIEGYQVRQNSLTYSSAGVSVTNQGPIQ